MYQIMTADEAMDLINDGDVIALNSFLGIDIPIELHEALYKRYQRTGSPKHLTAISSAGFGAWDENKAAEGRIYQRRCSRQTDLWTFRSHVQHQEACP